MASTAAAGEMSASTSSLERICMAPRVRGFASRTSRLFARVWMVRDALETAVREAGKETVPYSSMTEANRKKAAVWFGVGDYR